MAKTKSNKAKKKVIDEKTVKRVARLSRIELKEREVKQYSVQLTGILAYISKLNEVDSSNVSPTSHPIEGLRNVFRKDAARKSLTQEEALQNAPVRKDNFFSVPKIIG